MDKNDEKLITYLITRLEKMDAKLDKLSENKADAEELKLVASDVIKLLSLKHQVVGGTLLMCGFVTLVVNVISVIIK